MLGDDVLSRWRNCRPSNQQVSQPASQSVRQSVSQVNWYFFFSSFLAFLPLSGSIAPQRCLSCFERWELNGRAEPMPFLLKSSKSSLSHFLPRLGRTVRARSRGEKKRKNETFLSSAIRRHFRRRIPLVLLLPPPLLLLPLSISQSLHW